MYEAEDVKYFHTQNFVDGIWEEGDWIFRGVFKI